MSNQVETEASECNPPLLSNVFLCTTNILQDQGIGYTSSVSTTAAKNNKHEHSFSLNAIIWYRSSNNNGMSIGSLELCLHSS